MVNQDLKNYVDSLKKGGHTVTSTQLQAILTQAGWQASDVALAIDYFSGATGIVAPAPAPIPASTIAPAISTIPTMSSAPKLPSAP